MFDRDEILQKALALPPDDRAYVASALEESLAADDDSQRIAPHAVTGGVAEEGNLAAELQRRSAAFRNGTTTSRPADEILADMRRRQQAETSK